MSHHVGYALLDRKRGRFVPDQQHVLAPQTWVDRSEAIDYRDRFPKGRQSNIDLVQLRTIEGDNQ
jgi:hypothetical protein